MINNLRGLWDAMANLDDPACPETKIRVYLNGRYMIEEVRLSEDDGAIVLWLDERGAENNDNS